MEQREETTDKPQPKSEDEATLIKKIAAGDQAALMTLYERTNRLVYGIVLRMVGEPSVAEEVLLDVYTDAWKKAPTCDPDHASLLTWLSTIAAARAADRIGMISTESVLPEYLADLLAARIEREPQSAPAQLQAPSGQEKEAGGHLTSPAAAPRTPIFAPTPQEVSRIPWLVAIGLAIAALLAFFAWRQADQAVKQLNEQLASAQADTTNLRALIEVQRGRNRELEQINSAISNRSTRVIHIHGQADAPSASIVIFWETLKKRWLITGRLPLAPEGKVYQLWFLIPGQNQSACLIETDPLGNIFKTLDIAADLSKLTGAEITLEREGGSRQPTPPVFAVGKLVQ